MTMGLRKGCKNIKYKSSRDHFISSAHHKTICIIISVKKTEAKTQTRNYDDKMTPCYNDFWTPIGTENKLTI